MRRGIGQEVSKSRGHKARRWKVEDARRLSDQVIRRSVYWEVKRSRGQEACKQGGLKMRRPRDLVSAVWEIKRTLNQRPRVRGWLIASASLHGQPTP